MFLIIFFLGTISKTQTVIFFLWSKTTASRKKRNICNIYIYLSCAHPFLEISVFCIILFDLCLPFSFSLLVYRTLQLFPLTATQPSILTFPSHLPSNKNLPTTPNHPIMLPLPSTLSLSLPLQKTQILEPRPSPFRSLIMALRCPHLHG